MRKLASHFQGSDEGMILKCNQNHSKNKHYVKAKSDVSSRFGIKHYAGTVTYTTEGFQFYYYNNDIFYMTFTTYQLF